MSSMLTVNLILAYSLIISISVQALSSFSSALQSGQLGPLMTQFGLGEDVANAAAQGGKNHVYSKYVLKLMYEILSCNC